MLFRRLTAASTAALLTLPVGLGAASAASAAPVSAGPGAASLRAAETSHSLTPKRKLAARTIKPGKIGKYSLASTLAAYPNATKVQVRLRTSSGSSGKLAVRVPGQAWKKHSAKRVQTGQAVSTLPVTSAQRVEVRNHSARKLKVTVVAERIWQAGTTNPAPPNNSTPPDSSPPDSEQPSSPETPSSPDTNPAPVGSNGRYDWGNYSVTDIWVNPVSGSDSANGNSRATALRTVNAAWGRIPASTTLSQGYRIQLVPGEYSESVLVNYWENRWGTRNHPIILNAVDGAHTVTFRGDVNLYNSRYVYFDGIDIVRDADTFHCELCSYVLVRKATLNGDRNPGGGTAHETVKVNQSDHFMIEDSTISGAEDNAVDFVAVQYGHLIGNQISNAEDWCAYAKGGSAHLTITDNEIHHCGTGGFTAGQGTGFEFMTSPWINYEAFNLKVTNNIIHDTAGAGLGVNGGYNILLAYNTLYRVGTRSHLIEFTYGLRSCDAANAGQSVAGCASRLASGGWGVTNTAEARIPNRRVYFYNNVILNPAGVQSQWQHFEIPGSVTQSSSYNVPNPAQADGEVRIAGNVIWNGSSSMPLGLDSGSGCAPGHATCSPSQILAANSINAWQPQYTNPAGGDYSPVGTLTTTAAVAIPDFTFDDAPAAGMGSDNGSNQVPLNRLGQARSGWGRPGAF